MVTLDDARRQLRLEPDDYERDEELQQFIEDAASWVERYTGHILEAREVTETFDSFDRLRLRAWPIKPDAVVTMSNIGGDGAPVAVTGARLRVEQRPAQLLSAFGQRWPAVGYGGSVSVTVRAGYEEGDAIPGCLRRAMLALIGAYDADREGGDVLARAQETARALCGQYRLVTV